MKSGRMRHQAPDTSEMCTEMSSRDVQRRDLCHETDIKWEVIFKINLKAACVCVCVEYY